jgi:GAF domain-containing protein
LSRLGKAALVVPIKVRDQAMGVICVARQEHRPFSERNQAMLEAVADYASISLVNARLFMALETRAQRLQRMVEQGGAHAQLEWRDRLAQQVREVQSDLARLLSDTRAEALSAELTRLGQQLDRLVQELSDLPEAPVHDGEAPASAVGGSAH